MAEPRGYRLQPWLLVRVGLDHQEVGLREDGVDVLGPVADPGADVDDRSRREAIRREVLEAPPHREDALLELQSLWRLRKNHLQRRPPAPLGNASEQAWCEEASDLCQHRVLT
jgi:hypothetical protein